MERRNFCSIACLILFPYSLFLQKVGDFSREVLQSIGALHNTAAYSTTGNNLIPHPHHRVPGSSSSNLNTSSSSNIPRLPPPAPAGTTSLTGPNTSIVAGPHEGQVYIVQPPAPPVLTPREPDSGISSARSTGTVPWSHNEVGLPALQPAMHLSNPGEEEHQL